MGITVNWTKMCKVGHKSVPSLSDIKMGTVVNKLVTFVDFSCLNKTLSKQDKD